MIALDCDTCGEPGALLIGDVETTALCEDCACLAAQSGDMPTTTALALHGMQHRRTTAPLAEVTGEHEVLIDGEVEYVSNVTGVNAWLRAQGLMLSEAVL